MTKYDFEERYGNVTTQISGAVAAKSRSEENQTMVQLFKFVEEWYHNYRLVCKEFDLYHKVPVNGVVPFGCYDSGIEDYGHGFRKVDFFSVNFFEKILNKTCIFEKITQPIYNYDGFNESRAYNHYVKSPDSKLCIKSERFTLSRESNDVNRMWALDTRMANNQSPQQGLVLSLITTLMNNYFPLGLYKRNKHFRNFIDKFSEGTQFDFRFESNDRVLVVFEGEIMSVPDCTIFKHGKWSEESVVIDHDRFNSNNLLFSYKHLDELFGKNRKEPLTYEDLQLYSICNEGRKPFIRDWEFDV